jgi:enediyne biosynthesis protein E4
LRLFTMGIGAGDYDKDGDLDLFQSTIGPHVLMRNDEGQFVNATKEANVYKVYPVSDPPVYTTHWSAIFTDLDNDSWEDLYVVHGTLKSFPPWNTIPTDTTVFYHNLGGKGSVGRFEDVSTSTGFVIDVRARTGTVLDYDQDGRVDLTLGALHNAIEFPSLGYYLIRNVTPAAGNWIQVDLQGKSPNPKEAIGAIVRVWAGGDQQLRVVSTGGSMLSQNSLVQHIGLGTATHADSISIQWPNRRGVEVRYNVPANSRYQALEGSWASSKSVAGKDNHSAVTVASVGSEIRVEIAEAATYRVLDVLGKVVKVGDVRPILNVSELSIGAYFLELELSNGRRIVERVLRY